MTWAEGRGFNPLSHPGTSDPLFKFIYLFSNSYLNSSYLTYGVVLVSGVEFSDSSLTYNTQCSSQVPCLIPTTLLRFYLFIWQREREREITSRQRSRQREKGKQAPRWAGSPMRGSILGSQDHDLSWRQKLNPLNHPGILVQDFMRLMLIFDRSSSLRTTLKLQ